MQLVLVDKEDDSIDDDTPTPTKRPKLSRTAKFVNNKTVKLEKNLSANKRDQILIGLTRDELGLKKGTVKELATSTKMMEKVHAVNSSFN